MVIDMHKVYNSTWSPNSFKFSDFKFTTAILDIMVTPLRIRSGGDAVAAVRDCFNSYNFYLGSYLPLPYWSKMDAIYQRGAG